MRMTFCRALILLRHRNLLSPVDLLTLFFDLLKCPDKTLRRFLRDHIINDVKGVNTKQKDARLNSSLQNFMFKMLASSEKSAAKTSLDVMIELYQKSVWRDAKTVNVIATACLSDVTKIMVTAIKFFLGKDEGGEDKNDDSDDEEELPTVKSVAMANKVNKKSRKREKLLDNIKKAHRKKKKKDKVESFNFSALHLIHDPQGFAEKLYKKLDGLKEKFEVKLMFLDLISRLIGTHELFLLSFHQYIARFITPHQREVVQMLQFAAQAAHELVPADAVEPVIRAIVNNFVTERNAAEVMAVGLNAVREICKRCPLAMDQTLLRDLAGYKSYKDKGVMMAARSLIALYKSTNPELLHKKDRGRTTEAMAENRIKQYGEVDARDYVPGAEAVSLEAEEQPLADEEQGHESDSDGWVDVQHSDEDFDLEEEIEEEEEEEEEELADDQDDEEKSSPSPSTSKSRKILKAKRKSKGSQSQELLSLEERKQKAANVASNRILTDADFKKIDAAQLRKQVTGFKKGKKRKMVEVDDDEEEKRSKGREELVDLASIEMVHKKRKHDKETRMASIMEGRKDRDKYGSRKGKASEHASTTHKEKAKKKSFMMVKHKIKRKAKRSFSEKARDLKKAMLRAKKFR